MSSDIVPHAGGVVALTVDDDFRSLIPPLTDDEYMRLERSIIAEGVRDPIITWNGTIVDGHNRYRICQEHGIAFKTAEIVFGSKDAAKIWIIENQFGRRNLNSYQKSVLALQLEPLYAAEAKKRQQESGGNRGNQYTGGKVAVSQISVEPPIRTDERLAQVAGVSRDTIRKVKVIEAEAAGGNETAIAARDAVRSGEKSIHAAYTEVHHGGDESDTRRICVVCGKPIEDGDAYDHNLSKHKSCAVADGEMHRGSKGGRKPPIKHRDPDETLSSNVPVFTPLTLIAELSQSADEFGRSVRQSLEINEENGAALTARQRKRLIKAVDNINAVINEIAEEYRNA